MRSLKKIDLTKLRAVIDSNKCDKLRECFVSVSELANTLKKVISCTYKNNLMHVLRE